MPRPRVSRLVLSVVALALVVVLVATVVVAAVVVRRPLPQVSGEVELSGLDAEVSVVRDDLGVPHITAKTADDLFRAQGYVHAQDRFFEMDYRRHVTAGRLSELVGENEDALAADKVVRTLGWRRVAEQELPLLAPSTQEYLQAYADGVNAYLEGREPGEIAVEYTILGLRVDVADPEPWTPADSLAWLKAMAWDLRSNYDDEVFRATAYATVGDVARVEELFPAYPEDTNLPILTGTDAQTVSAQVATDGLDLADAGVQRALTSVEEALASVPRLIGEGEGTGSNSWVVSGEHTVSGNPVLANDPHLGISAPGIWSQVSLRCETVDDACPFDVAGFSFAGFPGVVIGHNAHLAWGLTNMGADVTDLFLERVVERTTLVDGERVPMDIRRETIKVNGGADVDLVVRESVHGPIVSDVLDMDGVTTTPVSAETPWGAYEVALRWTALEPSTTADAIFAFGTARDAADVAEAAALFSAPAQNIVYATVDGHIGYQAPGLVPVRNEVPGALPSDGSWPRPGWDSAYDWQGWISADELPAVQDPAEGYVVTANQAVTGVDAGPFLSNDFDYGYRSQRIREVLEQQIAAGTKIDVASTEALQLDDLNPFAQMLVPALLDVPIADAFDDDGQELLRDWDLRSDVDSPAAAYFAAVWSTLLRLTFWDDVPDGYEPTGGSRWLEVVRAMIDDPQSPWWDDRSTVGVVEGRDEILTRALVSARSELTVSLGKVAQDWTWGQLHTVAPTHAVLGGEAMPGIVRRLVNPGAIGVAGGSSIVDATSWDAGSGSFTVTAAPSMRMVVDLGDLDSSTWVTLTGASGHPASSHYADQLGAWARGETYPWPFTPDAVGDAARDTLTLVPAGSRIEG
ncbi:penicillin acylase family protein [Cellulomonas sp. P22]|uniref:penicillin acylase family protein n=1 Tax=Cellulomonas sp. P22 TaxID=3373189 RepID=UPI00378BC057